MLRRFIARRALSLSPPPRLLSSLTPPPGSATATLHADALAGKFSTDMDVAPPLSLSTTFTTSDGGHVYSRISSPTRDRAEMLLSAVESTSDTTAHAVLYASGLAATFGALARLLPKRVAISGGYHGTHLVLSQLSRISAGAHCTPMPLPPPSSVASTLRPGDLLWLETPRNPDCELADIAAYVEAARSVGNVKVVVDGTFAPPPLQYPLSLGADMVMHATTKGLCGHSDAVGGAVCVSDEGLAQELRSDRTALGSTPGSLEVWLLQRSLRTLHLRVKQQSESAAALAEWLHRAVVNEAGHPLAGRIASVRHPSLPSDPSHAVAKKQMADGLYGGCFAMELTTEGAARALPQALTYFRDATSLGGVESLIEWRRKYDDAISPTLLRVSVGLEDVEELKRDLQEAVLSVS